MKIRQRGFTLIELLIVIGIIGFLAAAILVAVDPVKRIQDSRDARRSEEVYSLLNALLNKQVDDRAIYNGETDAPIITQGSTNVQVIVRSSAGIACNAISNRPGCDKPMDGGAANQACVANLSGLVPTYISELPVDPRGSGSPCGTGGGCVTTGDIPINTSTTSLNTGYYIQRTSGNRIEIGSCKPEQAASIFVRR